jgi:hypothetical protein
MSVASIHFGRAVLDRQESDAVDSSSSGWCSLQLPGLEALVADCRLLGGVTELAGPSERGGITQLALRLISAIHRAQAGSWCVWFDPERTLHAPGVAQAGVDLRRLMVVHAPEETLAQWVLRTVNRGLFDGLVVDVQSALLNKPAFSADQLLDQHWVRRLTLASEKNRTRVLLLTDASEEHDQPWPVAQKLKCKQPEPDVVEVEIAKARHGTVTAPKRISLVSVRTRWKRGG